MTLFMADEKSCLPCSLCGKSVVEFTIPNDIWNKVIRPDGHEHDKEYICLNCWYGALRVVLGLSDAERRGGNHLLGYFKEIMYEPM